LYLANFYCVSMLKSGRPMHHCCVKMELSISVFFQCQNAKTYTLCWRERCGLYFSISSGRLEIRFQYLAQNTVSMFFFNSLLALSASDYGDHILDSSNNDVLIVT